MFEERKIILNQMRTPDGTILTSHGRHDWVAHKDKKTRELYFTDGGTCYLHRSANKVPAEDLTVYSNASYEVIRKSLHRGGHGKNGDQPLKWVPLYQMSDDWLRAVIVYNNERGLQEYNRYFELELKYRKKNGISVAD